MLCTLARPTSGTARVSGFDVAAARDDVRRHIGLVFQDQTLDGHLTAEQNLRLHAELYGIDPGSSRRGCARCSRWSTSGTAATTPVMTFSGGMRRRLEIARGLMHSPRVLFLDEPTIGLDPQTRSSIWRYIRALQETEGTTIFMTTHYMDEAEFCDRIAIMDRGEIVVLDTPEALKASVGADRVVLGTDDDEAALAALRDRFGIEATVAEGAVTFHVASGEAFVPAAVRRARRRRSRRSRCRGRRWTTSSCATRARRSGTPRPDRRAISAARRCACCRGPADERRVADVVAVRVPERSWRSEVRAVRIVWRRDLIRFADDRMRIATMLIQPLLFLFVLGTGLQTLVGRVHRRRRPQDLHLPRGPLHGAGVQRDVQRGVAGDGPRVRVPAGDAGRAGPAVVDRRRQVPRRRDGRDDPGRDPAGPCRPRARALRPRAAARPLRPAAADRLHGHRLRRDGGRPHQADPDVHDA